MKYTNREIRIRDLVQLIEKKQIDLQPPYQRNFIWSSSDQKSLIDSISKGYPIPNFFTFKNNIGLLEMVDGQQRAKTIYRFITGEIKAKKSDFFSNIDIEKFLDYRLNVVEISDLSEDESLEEFFYLVNKRGVHLNPAEINKAYFYSSEFLKLVNEVMSIDEFSDLEIFTSKAEARMLDRSLIEELVAYLFKGITEKRNAVDDLFRDDMLVENKKDEIIHRFKSIIDKIYILNQIKPINKTRFKQRNDFYTLFCFIDLHLSLKIDILKYQYETLVFIDNNGFINPNNEGCMAFREYALNCVSQTNSKIARQKRLDFFNSILCNTDLAENDILQDVVSYISGVFETTDIDFIQLEDFQLLDIHKFN